MPSKKRLITLLLPEGLSLGLASKFSKTSRPLVKIDTGSLNDGDYLLQLTLKHLGMIRRMSRETNDPHPELFQDAKSQYDDLKEELARLVQVSKSTPLIKVLKRIEIKRDTKALVEAGYELYITTRSTSDKMERALLSCSSMVEEVEEKDIPSNKEVRGVAFVTDELADEETEKFLAGGLLDGETSSIVTSDPFADPILTDHQMSLQKVVNVYIGCVNADNSDARVITMNNGGKGQ